MKVSLKAHWKVAMKVFVMANKSVTTLELMILIHLVL